MDLDNLNESILCIGACNIDYKFRARDKIIKKTSNPVDSLMSYGGVIRNVGENLSHLNQDVSLMTLLGDDILGEKLILDLKEYMDVSLIDKRDNQSTGQYYAVMDSHGDMDVAYANMSIYENMDDAWIISHSESFKNYAWIVVDLNVQMSGIARLIELSNMYSMKLAVIGVSGPKMKNLPSDIKGIDLLIVNKDESQTYFESKEDSKTLCNFWLNKGVKRVVVTSGKEDVYFGDQLGVDSLSVIEVENHKLIDSTGAGDAFSGGVLLGLIKKMTLLKSVVYGMVNASLNIQSQDSVRKDINETMIIQEVKKYESI